jgi:DNA-binding response OmpR family regulator
MSKNILCVDDSVVLLNLIKLLLEQAGYTAVAARNGGAALSMAGGKSFVAMVIGVKPADDNGMMLTNFLMHHHRGVPVIVYSAKEMAQANSVKLLALGAHKFIQKCNGLELVNAVKELCP